MKKYDNNHTREIIPFIPSPPLLPLFKLLPALCTLLPLLLLPSPPSSLSTFLPSILLFYLCKYSRPHAISRPTRTASTCEKGSLPGPIA